MNLTERIFHNHKEDYVLFVRIYGTKEELEEMQKKISNL